MYGEKEVVNKVAKSNLSMRYRKMINESGCKLTEKEMEIILEKHVSYDVNDEIMNIVEEVTKRWSNNYRIIYLNYSIIENINKKSFDNWDNKEKYSFLNVIFQGIDEVTEESKLNKLIEKAYDMFIWFTGVSKKKLKMSGEKNEFLEKVKQFINTDNKVGLEFYLNNEVKEELKEIIEYFKVLDGSSTENVWKQYKKAILEGRFFKGGSIRRKKRFMDLRR